MTGVLTDNQTGPMELDPLDDLEIVRIVDQWRVKAINEDEDELSNRRSKALDYYRMAPYGDEQKGYSQAVTGEVLETVEWALPSIVRTFTQGTPCKFRPLNSQDVDAAEHETQVVLWYMRSNPECFAEFVQWVKDALLQPNAYLKVWWDRRREYEFEEYDELTEEQMLAVMIDGKAQIVRAEPDERGMFAVSLRTTRYVSQLKFAAVPPEEVMVADNCTTLDLDEADYVVHEPANVTRNDLVAMGYDYDLVMSLRRQEDELSSSERTERRESVDENSGLSNPTDVEMMERVEYVEAYGRIDIDGDGYAEYRKICKVGDEVLAVEYITSQPFCTLTSLIQSHRHVGMSLAEPAMKIQRQNSALTRQALDNLYRTNRPRAILGQSINRDEWDDYKPHGGIRGNPSDYAPEVVPVSVQHVLPWLQHQSDQLASRTGISKHAMGLDAETLASSTMGAYLEAAGASSQRLEMVIRTFAQTGMAQFLRKVHELVRRHQDTELEVDISGEWVAVDPRGWKKRTDVVPCVGIGSGSQREKAASALQLLDLQREGVQYGLSTPAQAYNTLRELTEALGRSDVSTYFVDPTSEQGQALAADIKQGQEQQQALARQQVQQVVEIELARVKARYDEAMAKLQLELQKHRDKMEFDYTELEVENSVDVPGKGLDS